MDWADVVWIWIPSLINGGVSMLVSASVVVVVVEEGVLYNDAVLENCVILFSRRLYTSRSCSVSTYMCIWE